jgi:hypothetical protein
MSGPWIKMTTNLRRHPKVVRMASALKADRLRIVGGLHSAWSVFDEHSEDGVLVGYTPDILDEEIGWPGFTAAMIRVCWADFDGESLVLPEFDTHNGASAKRRAQDADRKRTGRSSASKADKKRTRGEERRGDSSSTDTSTTPPPAAAVALEGVFEGHDVPRETPNPAAAHAIALTRAGFQVTTMNPDLHAYVDAGGTVEHLQQVASLSDCAGKKAGYVLSIARREIAETAKPITGGIHATRTQGRESLVDHAAKRAQRILGSGAE